MSIKTSQSKFPVNLMFWLTEAFYVIAGIEADNHYLLESLPHVIIEIPN